MVIISNKHKQVEKYQLILNELLPDKVKRKEPRTLHEEKK